MAPLMMSFRFSVRDAMRESALPGRHRRGVTTSHSQWRSYLPGLRLTQRSLPHHRHASGFKNLLRKFCLQTLTTISLPPGQVDPATRLDISEVRKHPWNIDISVSSSWLSFQGKWRSPHPPFTALTNPQDWCRHDSSGPTISRWAPPTLPGLLRPLRPPFLRHDTSQPHH